MQAADQMVKPSQAGLVLTSLILVAGVANINLAVANVALPEIGTAFSASQTSIDLIAVGFSLGLAASVLYFGAIGDRYGRKLLLVLGVALSIPACLVASYAPTTSVLFTARLVGGLAAGMSYPTTLALITALWSGPARTRSIALWSAIGSAMAALGPLISGVLLEHFWWGSVFFFTLPLAGLALVMAVLYVPSHVNESTEPIDNLGGILSVVLIMALILAINLAPTPNRGALTLGLAAVVVIAAIAFALRQRRASNPLYDLDVAARRVFWVAAVGGLIVFGSLMGAMFIGQQFMQNVLGYSTRNAGIAILPAAIFMVLVAGPSARLVDARGSRFTLLAGYLFCLLSFLTMLVLWGTGSPYVEVGLAYAFLGIGVGLFGTPASRSLTSSVPVKGVGMASGTADLQRDLGGAIMQSIFGALLTAGYAKGIASAIAAAPNKSHITNSVQTQLEKSFSSATAVADQYPQYTNAITSAAKSSFLKGADWAYAAGVIATAVGIVVVLLFFPRKEEEERLLDEYHNQDAASGGSSKVT
jgi:MFS family permease